MKKEPIHIGEMIKGRIKEMGMTNSEFARRINCHRSTVNHIYKQSSIDIVRLMRIFDVLDINLLDFYQSNNCNLEDIKKVVKRIDFTKKELQSIIDDEKHITIEIQISVDE